MCWWCWAGWGNPKGSHMPLTLSSLTFAYLSASSVSGPFLYCLESKIQAIQDCLDGSLDSCRDHFCISCSSNRCIQFVGQHLNRRCFQNIVKASEKDLKSFFNMFGPLALDAYMFMIHQDLYFSDMRNAVMKSTADTHDERSRVQTAYSQRVYICRAPQLTRPGHSLLSPDLGSTDPHLS